MADISRHDFNLAQTADDFYDFTLDLCGKQIDEDGGEQGGEEKKKTYRFPLYLYPNYVTRILDTAGDIHQDIIVANESKKPGRRLELQEDAMGKCVYLNHLTRIAGRKGWVSSKQMERWKSLTNAIYWGTYNWMKSDLARKAKSGTG